MNYKKYCKLLTIIFAMLCPLQATASSTVGRVGKNLAMQAVRVGSHIPPKTVPSMQAVVLQQARLYSQSSPKVQVPQAATALVQQATAGKQSSDTYNMAKWLAVGGVAVAADVAHDEMNKIDFENIDMNTVPDFKECLDYLYYILKKDYSLEKGFDIEMIAYSIADKNFKYNEINKIVDEVKSLTYGKSISEIGLSGFYKAMNIVEYGKATALTLEEANKEKFITAYHEAAHAVMRAILLRPISIIDYLTVVPNEKGWGCVSSLGLVDSHDGLIARVVEGVRLTLLIEEFLIEKFAGGIAEDLYHTGIREKYFLNKSYNSFIKSPHVKEDIESARKLVKIVLQRINDQEWINVYKINPDATQDDKIDAIFKDIYEKTFLLVDRYANEIEMVANVAYRKGVISGEEIYKIIGVNPPLIGFQYDKQLAPIEKYLEYQ